MNIIAPTLLGRRRSWQPSSTAHPATIYYHSKLTQLLPHANQFAAAAFFTSSAPSFLSLETQLSNQVDKFFPVSEMRAQPSRASCLPRTKTDRRNLCEPRRYERRLPISEYHDLTLSRFSRYVASRGAREERVGAAGRSALFAQICPRACPSLPGLGTSTQSRIGVRFSADISQSALLVGLARISREISAGTAVAAQSGYRARRLDGLRPARLAQFSRSARNVKMVLRWELEEQSLRVVDRFRFCSISKLDCGRLMLGLRLTGLAWGCSTRTLRHLSLVKRQVWVGERDN